MAPFLLAHLPTIPGPPRPSTFASLSSATLLSLLCTCRVPRHPLVVIAWTGGSYFFNEWWRKLKIKQATATLLWEVDDLLKGEGACAACRKNVLRGGPRDLVRVMVDLKTAKQRRESAEKEKEVAEEEAEEELAERDMEQEAREKQMPGEVMDRLLADFNLEMPIAGNEEELAAAVERVFARSETVLQNVRSGNEVQTDSAEEIDTGENGTGVGED